MSEEEILIQRTMEHFSCSKGLAEKLIQSSTLNDELESFKMLVNYKKENIFYYG